MKNASLPFLLAFLLSACSSSNPNSLTFVRNAETVERVFRAFEAEEGEAFWAEFAETAVWRGTGVNAPTTLSREKMRGLYDAVWEEFDFKIVGDLHFQPGISPETQLPNGSVNGTFLWEVSRLATNAANDVPCSCGSMSRLTSTRKAKSSSPKFSPTSPPPTGNFAKRPSRNEKTPHMCAGLMWAILGSNQ
jgi:hypothetical protein